MAKKMYVGVDGKARRVKKLYVGVEGKARRVKKGYIGVGGIARPFFTGGEPTVYGEITALSASRFDLSAASNGSYLVFGTGAYDTEDNTIRNVVDAYNPQLTRSVPSAFSTGRRLYAGGNIGNYALFAGGRNKSTTRYKTGEVYDKSLTHTTCTALYNNRSELASAKIGNYLLFAGGQITNSSYSNVVDAIDASLTRTSATVLQKTMYGHVGASNKNYALFSGGVHTSKTANYLVDAYNASLTHSTPTAFSNTSGPDHAVSTGNHVLFGLGSSNTFTINAYDNSLTRTVLSSFSGDHSYGCTASLEGFAFFINGGRSYSGTNKNIDVFDESLTRTTLTSSFVRQDCAAGTIGNYIICAGGYGKQVDETGNTSVLRTEAFTI